MSEYIWSNEDITVLGVKITHEDILQKNYQDIHEKIRNVLNAWYNRGLSLLGKVQVVNTLVASLFVYKMMVLPSMKPYMVKNINNIIREFIWNGKKSKISYSILQNSKKEGGLNLVNLEVKDKALKATWPKILAEENEYAQLVYGILKCPILSNNIWRCSLKKEDVDSIRIKEEFWVNTLKSWVEYNYYRNRHTENQIIWRNSNIKVSGKTIMWNDIAEKGLLYVYQLFENLQFRNGKELEQLYGLTPLRYNSLKKAIPKEWREYFCTFSRSEFFPLPPLNYDRALYTANFSKIVYQELNADILLIHNKYIKWRVDLETELCESFLDYGPLHTEVYKLTNIAKYRSFQYRLLQRSIVTNIQLRKWNIIPDDICSFCKEQQETNDGTCFGVMTSFF